MDKDIKGTINDIRNCSNCIYFHDGMLGHSCYAEINGKGEQQLCAFDADSIAGLCAFWEEKIDTYPCICENNDINLQITTKILYGNRTYHIYYSQIKCTNCGKIVIGEYKDSPERAIKSAVIAWNTINYCRKIDGMTLIQNKWISWICDALNIAYIGDNTKSSAEEFIHKHIEKIDPYLIENEKKLEKLCKKE